MYNPLGKAKVSAGDVVSGKQYWSDPSETVKAWTGGVKKGPGQIGHGLSNDILMEDTFSNGGGADERKPITPVADVGAPGMSGFRGEGMADPRTAIIDQAAQAQFRTQQQNLIGQLAMQASGRGPSVAGAQLHQASQANQAATFAQLASARGASAGNPGLARNAMNTSANIQAQTSRDAAVARMQEQMNAQGQLGNVISAGRQQDIGMATSQAQLGQHWLNHFHQILPSRLKARRGLLLFLQKDRLDPSWKQTQSCHIAILGHKWV